MLPVAFFAAPERVTASLMDTVPSAANVPPVAEVEIAGKKKAGHALPSAVLVLSSVLLSLLLFAPAAVTSLTPPGMPTPFWPLSEGFLPPCTS